MPVALTLLHGVVASFWKYVLQHVSKGEPRPGYVIPKKSQKVMEARSKEITYTADFGRPYRSALPASLSRGSGQAGYLVN